MTAATGGEFTPSRIDSNLQHEEVCSADEVAQGLIRNDFIRYGIAQFHGFCHLLRPHLQVSGEQQRLGRSHALKLRV